MAEFTDLPCFAFGIPSCLPIIKSLFTILKSITLEREIIRNAERRTTNETEARCNPERLSHSYSALTVLAQLGFLMHSVPDPA